VMRRGWRPAFRLFHAFGLTALLALGPFIASLVLNGMPGATPEIYANLIMIPGFVALIAACAGRDLSGSSTLFGSTTLVRLGQWSFALYLIHELVIRLARPFLSPMSASETFGGAILAAVVSLALSGLLHEFAEKPAEKWLRSRRRPEPIVTGIRSHQPEE
jgi:peptidoglycan/LPS O-acetylase OafA/YrhL